MISFEQTNSFSNIFKNKISECTDFGSFIHQLSPIFAEVMACQITKTKNSFEEKYLFTPLTSFFSNSGKCARPLICLLSNYSFAGEVSSALSSAVAIETFQNAALIHDDIADDATIRREKKCLHVSEGLGIALNSGDYALSLVDRLVLEDKHLSDELKLKILKEMSNMKLNTIKGQAIDIGWARDHKFDQQIDDYENMATLKTAHYTCSTPIVIGAMIAGVNGESLNNLRAFGIKCGLAFQIQDDILNVDENSKDDSKDFALDIKTGKRTIIVIHAINNLSTKGKNRLIEILDSQNNTSEDIEEALFLINSTGSIGYSKTKCETLINEANDIIITVEKGYKGLEILKSMPNWCLSRKK